MLSRGLRQKASLLLSLVRPYEVLLLDEPYAGLDESGWQALNAITFEAAESALVIVASHDKPSVATLRRIELDDGRLVD